jgi:phospholipid/cholesterol/gamma-HCH transport system substrate-binding protein
MPNRGARLNPALVGVVAATVMFGLLFFAFGNVALFASTIDMKAQVATGDTLAPGADVEIAGVKVGTVKNIGKGDPGALIDMSIDTKKATIHKDASILIRPHGFFGPKFVQVDPGSSSADSFADGDSVPITRTRVSVDFQDVINTLDTNTRVSLQTLFVEFGTASDGHGTDFGQFLDALHTVETQLTPVLQVIDSRAANTGRIFENNAVLAETYANSPFDQILKKNADAFAKLDAASPSLTGVIDHGNNVLASLDAITAGGNTQALATTISKLPALFDNLQKFNNDLGYGVNAVAPALTPQRGQVDSDVAVALKRSMDAFGQCDITDQTISTTLGSPLTADGVTVITDLTVASLFGLSSPGMQLRITSGTNQQFFFVDGSSFDPVTSTNHLTVRLLNPFPATPPGALPGTANFSYPAGSVISDARGLADTQHASFVRIVPCYGSDGLPYKDAAGHVAHHHVGVILDLHNHPIDPIVQGVIPASIVKTLQYPQSFQDSILGDNEGSVLCGPNSGNSTRGTNPAFLCKSTAQSSAIAGFGTAPPALFGQMSAAALAANPALGPLARGTVSPTALGSANAGLVDAGLGSRRLDLAVGLVLLVGAAAIGFGFWRVRQS